MRQLWLLLVKAHYVLLFIFLQAIALLWLFNTQTYHKSVFYGATNGITNTVHEKRQSIRDFFSLNESNRQLALENAQLKGKLLYMSKDEDSLSTTFAIDSSSNTKFVIRTAKVVSNDFNRSKNYITIDKGSKDGIAEGFGVMSPNGIAGKVVATSKNYAVCLPLVNTQGRWNVQHAISGNNGNLSWNGSNIKNGTVTNIPRHVKIAIGDSIVTNNYSKIFPEGEAVGAVEEINYDASGNFYDLKINFFTGFRKLNMVYIYEREDLAEILELENQVN